MGSVSRRIAFCVYQDKKGNPISKTPRAKGLEAWLPQKV
jgi:hypothetical protein